VAWLGWVSLRSTHTHQLKEILVVYPLFYIGLPKIEAELLQNLTLVDLILRVFRILVIYPLFYISGQWYLFFLFPTSG